MKYVDYGNGIKLFHGDCRDFKTEAKGSFVFLDPPFNIYGQIPIPTFETCVAFTNWQNRKNLTDRLGEPRIEMIWHFADGRWVSPKMPRITHENILLYGNTGDAEVGEENALYGQKIKKGSASIGKDKLGKRIYTPKRRKHINSVLSYPRNVSAELGCWSKPFNLIYTLFEFVDQPSVFDPFMGTGTGAVAAIELGMGYTGIEKDEGVFHSACKRVEAHLSQGDLFRVNRFEDEAAYGG
jgi:hypothetical protein